LYCIDRLGEAFGRLAQRDIPSPLRVDDEGRLRIVAESRSLEQLACPAFLAVARYGSGDSDVVHKLLETLDALIAIAPPGSTSMSEVREKILRLDETQLTAHSDIR
jgi:uncharacterized membrane protein